MQLTIFDAIKEFNESHANIKGLAEFKYCYVTAIIPKDLKFPWDLRSGSPEFMQAKDRWSNYVWAIFNREIKMPWERAIRILDEHRESGEPVRMKITLNNNFRPDEVVEYL